MSDTSSPAQPPVATEVEKAPLTPVQQVARLAKLLAEELERVPGYVNVHGRGEVNLYTLERVGNLGATVPTITGASVRSYAQYGEDVIVRGLLMAHAADRYRQKKITYLDVGANHPINISNTWLLYEEGMQGILVEPNPKLYPELEKLRPRDTLIKGVVSVDGAKEVDFYLPRYHELGSLNLGFINAYYEQRNLQNRQMTCLKVAAYEMNDLIAAHCPDGIVDFLTIDVEGFDFEILSQVNWEKTRPTVVCLEPSTGIAGCGLEDNDKRMTDYMHSKNYILASATPANLIFLDGTLPTV